MESNEIAESGVELRTGITWRHVASGLYFGRSQVGMVFVCMTTGLPPWDPKNSLATRKMIPDVFMSVVNEMLGTVGEHQDVRAFHDRFGIINPSTPHFLNKEAQEFRVKFMKEELQEFQDSYEVEDMHGAADALVDLAYVVHGTALMMGIPWAELWKEVQKKNMEKQRAKSADESKRGSKLDVIKPEGWTPPNHVKALGSGPWPFTPVED